MKKYAIFFILLIIYQSINAQTLKKDHSVLATGKWIKISASTEGICKITYDQLISWGISSPENVGVYTNQGYMLPKMNSASYPDDLQKIPVLHEKDKSGNNAIFFYCSGSIKWDYDVSTLKYKHTLNLYTDKTFFYLSSDVGKSETLASKAEITGNPDVTLNSFDEHLLYELEVENLAESGRRWYSEEIMTSSSKKSYSFKSPNVLTSENAILTIAGAGGAQAISRYNIEVNNEYIGSLQFQKASETAKGRANFQDYSIKSNADLKVSLTYESDGNGGSSWLDYISITQKTGLTMADQPLFFRNNKAREYSNVKYNIQGSVVSPILWDISDPLQPVAVKFTKNSNSISFIDKGLKISEYVLFDIANNNLIEPEFVSEIANQDIHGLPLYDFIIVTHPNFLEASQTLAEYHRQKDQMSVLVLTTDEIFNEFSSGMPDVTAIRNMARMFYKQKTDTDSLRYILLMGDGHFNNRTHDGSVPNFIPTYQSPNSEDDNSFSSDDFFVLLDDNEGEAFGLIDIGIGRIPCRTIEEAELVVNKTIGYLATETMGDWRNIITFLADDEDNNQHMDYTEQLVSLVKEKYPGFYEDKIYFDSYTQIKTSGGDRYPDVTSALKQRVEDGTLILNYTGHANERGLAHENVLQISDINSWSNQKKLPVFITATCEFSRYDKDETSAGEEILLNPAGGGVALFSTSRVVYSNQNFELNYNFYQSVFQQDNDGNNFRMGDIMRKAKNLTSSGDNKRNFILLGDPALTLAFPKYKVVTDKINNIALADSISTIRALEKVTIEGKVVDHLGNLLSNFTGELSTTIYDKEMEVQTLNNDGGRAFEYSSQNNVIYKGTVSVTNGKFQVSFIVPKDILYNIDKGKIFYYATNNVEDGNGATDQFRIGGSSPNPIIDNDPPEVEMFLNNENFKTNDKVSSSALLLVNLFDESGINMVGTGIGHDLVAVLDGDYSNPMILNDFYKSELNSYQYGKVLYPLNNLSPGQHTISIKVWDVQNNSTVKELSFIVEEGFEITSVTNYPNPVSFNTTFEISHNLPGDVFDTTVEIFNLRGLKIYEINQPTGSYGSVEATVRWEVTDTNYPIDKEKILVYRVTMVNQQGLRATGAGKLLLRLN